MEDNRTISQRPYADRQLVVVAADNVIQVERAARAKAAEDLGRPRDKAPDWPNIIAAAAGVVGLVVAPGVAVPLLGPRTIVAIKTLLSADRRLREQGITIHTVSQTEARNLEFPLGHPRFKVLYVGHPAMPTSYMPMADFHRVLFEHKVAEAFQLLTSLGARALEIERLTGKSSLTEMSTSLGIPAAQVKAELGADVKAGKTSQILFRASFDPTGVPVLPTGLVWYPHEPLWQAVATARLQYVLSSFALDVRYENDFGINARLKAQAVKAGLEAGGKFEDHEATVWRMKGTFANPSGPLPGTS